MWFFVDNNRNVLGAISNVGQKFWKKELNINGTKTESLESRGFENEVEKNGSDRTM